MKWEFLCLAISWIFIHIDIDVILSEWLNDASNSILVPKWCHFRVTKLVIHQFLTGDKDKLQEEEVVVALEEGVVVAVGVEVDLEEGVVQVVEEVVLQEAVVVLGAEEEGFRLLLL